MEGTYDMLNIKILKKYFLHDYWTKSDGVFAKRQIISYNFIILKHIQINSQISKDIDAESPIIIFLGQPV